MPDVTSFVLTISFLVLTEPGGRLEFRDCVCSAPMLSGPPQPGQWILPSFFGEGGGLFLYIFFYRLSFLLLARILVTRNFEQQQSRVAALQTMLRPCVVSKFFRWGFCVPILRFLLFSSFFSKHRQFNLFRGTTSVWSSHEHYLRFKGKEFVFFPFCLALYPAWEIPNFLLLHWTFLFLCSQFPLSAMVWVGFLLTLFRNSTYLSVTSFERISKRAIPLLGQALPLLPFGDFWLHRGFSCSTELNLSVCLRLLFCVLSVNPSLL